MTTSNITHIDTTAPIANLLETLNTLRQSDGKAPLASWKNGREKLLEAISKLNVIDITETAEIEKSDATPEGMEVSHFTGELQEIQPETQPEVNEPEPEAVVEQNAAEPEKHPRTTGASDIIRKYMLSGEEFIRQEVIDEVQALDPNKDKKVILNTVGALMATISKKENLTKVTRKNESKITVFKFIKPVVQEAAPQEQAPQEPDPEVNTEDSTDPTMPMGENGNQLVD